MYYFLEVASKTIRLLEQLKYIYTGYKDILIHWVVFKRQAKTQKKENTICSFQKSVSHQIR